MTKLKQILLVAGCAAALSFTTGKVAAQGRGNFDPAQIKQGIVDSYKDRMNVTNDDEWKVLQVAISKVVDAGADVRAGTIRSFGNFGGGNRRNRGNNNSTNSTDTANPPRQRGGPGGFGQPSAEADDLQKAIEAKAPKDEIATKLAKLREANTANEAKLVAAQDDLKKLLTPRQEAVAVVYGLLK
jgi:hypothetical protein